MIDFILKIINEIRESKNLSSVNFLIESHNLRNDLGLDSIDLAELTVKIEDEYGVDVFEDGLVDNIGQILEKLK